MGAHREVVDRQVSRANPMPLDPRLTPDGECVKAFTLMLGNEAGKMCLAYLTVLVEHIADDKHTLPGGQGALDPLKLAQGDAARWLLRHIKSIPALPASRDWQELERKRKLAAAQQRLEGQNNG
jgi:hypothetical protein